MATATEGTVSISYRPLSTLDELHVLLLAAVSARPVAVPLLERIFSLPEHVIFKELTVLQGYGLAQKARVNWKATSRGQRLIAVWNVFQNSTEAEVGTTGRDWLLGPGEFAVDELTRDKDEIEALAREFAVADSEPARKFLDERRAVVEFDAFVSGWPPRAQGDPNHGVFSEGLVLANLRLAETDESLTRLEELLATHVGEVVRREQEAEGAQARTNGDGKIKKATSVSEDGQKVMKRFDAARRDQRRRNQHLASVAAVCEAILAGQWLSAAVNSLTDAFREEPAAFVFRSTVPLIERETPKQPTPTPATAKPQAQPRQEQEGVLRSLFRWLSGY